MRRVCTLQQSFKRQAPLTLLLALGSILLGCGGKGLPTESTYPVYSEGENIPFLTALDSSARGLLHPQGGVLQSWYVVGLGTVKPEDKSKSIKGSRYELVFPQGAVIQPVQVTISEFNSNVIEFQLGEHGLVFQKPVMLKIDYSGTNADPGSKLYDGSQPAFYWFNPGTSSWEQVPGTDDPKAKKYSIQLWHFSLYGLISSLTEGTANW